MLFFLLCAGIIFSTNAQKASIVPEIQGLWKDSNSVAFTDMHLLISQKGSKIETVHYLKFKGQSMIESGKGKYIANENCFVLKVKVSKGIPGWAEEGKHVLIFYPKDQSLRGYYEDNKGNKGPLVFFRVLS